ncbi:hypothetical protein [Longispora fulva]|uniref:Uncharacterized protein n=1 Tax=Longispora fulva TaxID=619741 RepID=A0A8J7GWB2_9ACTN|nr:hypothetical protein [Longispora fulva]MBG6140660.1 hypothetical protein [Longispora fulva]
MELFSHDHYDPMRVAGAHRRHILWVPGLSAHRARYAPSEGVYLMPAECDSVTFVDTLTHAQARAELAGAAVSDLATATARLASARLIPLAELAVALVAGGGGIEAAGQVLGVLPSTVRARVDTLTLRERRTLDALTIEARRDRGGRVRAEEHLLAARFGVPLAVS